MRAHRSSRNGRLQRVFLLGVSRQGARAVVLRMDRGRLRARGVRRGTANAPLILGDYPSHYANPAYNEGMTTMNRRLYPAIVAAAVALAVGGVYAATSSKENDALAISAAKIALSQAVSAADQHVGGKASRAEYERHKGQWVFDVEVVKDK